MGVHYSYARPALRGALSVPQGTALSTAHSRRGFRAILPAADLEAERHSELLRYEREHDVFQCSVWAFRDKPWGAEPDTLVAL